MSPFKWFFSIFLYTIITLLCVFLIDSASVFFFLRIFFGFTFVAVIPGYSLLNLLFKEGQLEFIETFVLSIALSFSVAGISGLFIGLSPIRINITSITLTLSIFVLIVAFLAMWKKLKFIEGSSWSIKPE